MAVFGVVREERAEYGCAHCARHQNDDGEKQ